MKFALKIYPLKPNGHGTTHAVEASANGKIIHREFSGEAVAVSAVPKITEELENWVGSYLPKITP